MDLAAKSKFASFPASWRHWIILALAWAHVVGSLFLPAARANMFIRYYGSFDGISFHRWLFFDLPPWILSNSAGYRTGYLSTLDFMWYISALLSVIFFVSAPLVLHYCRRPTTLTIVRCLSLILLTLPITLFLPARLNFPLPLVGMYFLAAAHLLTLVTLWLPRKRENILDAETAFTVQLNEPAERT